MNDNDTLQRFLFEAAAVRGELVRLDATWRAVLARHDYPPGVARVLGEMMAACALLAATLKFRGAVVMQIQGGGPLRLAVVECTAGLALRATAKWEGEATGNFAELVGTGRFAITLDPRDGGASYQGIVAVEGGSVGEALEHYMARSEQLPTRLILTADGERCGGLLLQKLPGRLSQDADAWNRLTQLADTLSPRELLGLPFHDILHRLFHEEDVRVFENEPVHFACSCSRARVADMLRLLGPGEVRAIIEEQGQVEVTCEFCNQRYVFDAVDAEQLFSAVLLASPGPTRH
ncbi:Hsp33 family molecular chaperone HslO [Thiobacter aerophilum]|uniref:33 kDa chaperonin n=1 Tax=Thiobacter aerophilum TaxID=3121275 RepID=A0ABV0EEQ3_9BURK